MRKLKVNLRSVFNFSAFLVIAFCALVAAPLLSSARNSVSSINVTNNSGRDILHVYLSAPGSDDWGGDQLNDTTLSSGQSVTLHNVTCSGSEVRVIAEDSDGCFVSNTVSCAGNADWTINSSASRDCGN